ncbi:hypothetical protein YC2023_063279 [Brassica napus]
MAYALISQALRIVTSNGGRNHSRWASGRRDFRLRVQFPILLGSNPRGCKQLEWPRGDLHGLLSPSRPLRVNRGP